MHIYIYIYSIRVTRSPRRQSYVPLPLGDNKINTDLARSFKQGWQSPGRHRLEKSQYVLMIQEWHLWMLPSSFIKHGVLENTLFAGDLPIETLISSGFPIATFD